jgi:ribosomal protein L20
MYGLHQANITLDRKTISNMAIEDKQAFSQLIAMSKTALEA